MAAKIQMTKGAFLYRGGIAWATLFYNPDTREASVEIRDGARYEDSRLLANYGVSGPGAKAFYDKAASYYFGDMTV